MNIAEISSQNVRKLLSVHKLSLRQLAAQIGASASTLSDAMRSRHGLSIEYLAAIAAYFHVSLDMLCDPAFAPERSNLFSADYARFQAAYRQLDAHGKQLVDTVLALELERCCLPSGTVAPFAHGTL